MHVYLPRMPHFPQTRDGTCLEACVCIVLAYLESPVTEERVCMLFEAKPEGTPASRVTRLSQWGFQITYGSSSIVEIFHSLQHDRPPIVFVQTDFLDYWAMGVRHAVVVAGIDDSSIWLHDPAFDEAPQQCSIDGFLAVWAEMDDTAAFATNRT